MIAKTKPPGVGELGNWLRTLRKLHGMTQGELAELSGAGADQRSQFAHLETKRQRTPLRSRDMVKKLATAFSIESADVEAMHEGRLSPESAYRKGGAAVAERLGILRAQKQRIPGDLQDAIEEAHAEGMRSAVAELWCKDQARHGMVRSKEEWADELRRVDRMHKATIRDWRRKPHGSSSHQPGS